MDQKGVKPEDVIGLFDSTVFGSAKDGYIITKDALYGKEFKGKCVKFDKLLSYDIVDKYDMFFKFKDGTNFKAYVYTGEQKMILTLLDTIFGKN